MVNRLPMFLCFRLSFKIQKTLEAYQPRLGEPHKNVFSVETPSWLY